MTENKLSNFLAALCFFLLTNSLFAQTATPTIQYIDASTETQDSVTMNAGDSQTAQAPLTIVCDAGLSLPEPWEATCEWRISLTQQGSSTPLLTRYDASTSYTLTQSGSYEVKLYVTYHNPESDATDECEYDAFTITISESELTCPNAFSPNDDGKNDVLRVSCKSIVKLEAAIFNRWGKKMASKSVNGTNGGYTENGTYYIDLWDGRYGGDYVKDGAYFLNLEAKGSDGVNYKKKITINVIKGFNETSEHSDN